MSSAARKEEALIRHLKQLCDQAQRLTKTSQQLCEELTEQIRRTRAGVAGRSERPSHERRRTKRS